VGLAVSLALGAGVKAQDEGAERTERQTKPGLPVPRFVSLKSDRVNVRRGPSTDHGVAWVFSRAGLPVEVIAESDNWRRVRDSEGADGWVFHSLLSGRRTVLVTPWVKDGEQTVALHRDRSERSAVQARLGAGVLGSVLACDGNWCRISIDSYSGWVQQEKLWGVYRDEVIR
jgi:SH3-like domain-containing protein